jgi:hypothetical protein
MHRPGRRIDEIQACDTDVLASQEKDEFSELVIFGKTANERPAELFHLGLVRIDEVVVKIAFRLVDVTGLAVDRAASLQGDVDEVFAVEQGVLVERFF